MKKYSLFFFGFFIILLSAASAWFMGNYSKETASSGDLQIPSAVTSQMRIENEGKLVVPQDILEDVWKYMLQRLVTDKTYIKSLDSNLDSYWYDELFTDMYFDTPALTMLNRESGIRYRTRVNLTNPESTKNGRELLQVKLNDIDSNTFNRGEIKFDIRAPAKPKVADDVVPVLGFLKPSDRADFKDLMSQLNIDPYALKPILTIRQRRRSIYLTRNNQAFISIRLDEDSSEMLWAAWQHVEIEPELNEIPYTKSKNAEREYMQAINLKLLDDIMEKFPQIKMDLTPKYNKAFNYFETKIPYLRSLIKYNFQ
jgi:hypothetical protein